MRNSYSFDDVLLVPKYSDIESRKEVNIGNKLGEGINLDLPLISSPMDTVTEVEMLLKMDYFGGLGVLHRYNTAEKQSNLAIACKERGAKNVGAAIGMTGDYMERAHRLVESGVNVLCVDVAHGHHKMMEACLKTLKDKFPSVHVMAGNVATLEAFDALAQWGADSIRVGIGGGSICSTRIVTGHGVTTLQSVLDVSRSEHDAKIIADGGIRTTGDMVKAYAAGADFIMVGSLLAGTDESPGEVHTNIKGLKYKSYRGMASAMAQNDWRGKTSTPEGISTTVPYKGPVKNILRNIKGGVQSGFSYSGARSMKELRANSEFIVQTSAGAAESSTHILARSR
mgnify:CR=1 FL=1